MMNTQEKFVITISRELGSGGHTIGRRLAERLNVRFCDKELIHALSEKFQLTPASIERLKSEKKQWLADFMRLVFPAPAANRFIGDEQFRTYGREFKPEITTDDIFLAETEILRELAEEESCVIAGRSGFFVLRNHPNKVDVFITASREKRIARVMAKQELSREQAVEIIDEVDKARENYIRRYAGTSRYDVRNYHLTLKVDDLSEDEAADIIMAYIKS